MDKYWIWLKILDIEYIKKLKLINKYRNIKEIYNLSNNILIYEYNFSVKEVNAFRDKQFMIKANEIYEYNKKRGIKIITMLDNNYPYLLKKIYNPPILLYYLGDIELINKKCLTIFQGLNIDEYGIELIKYISQNISNDKISIVSRMIKSDKYIYKNCKNNIMILSSGINEKFFLKTGLILSEYEHYVKNSKNNIIERNRLLTGISNEIMLIQTDLQDGVMYIIDFALDQGREIIVFPSDIFNIRNIYTNELIKQGVKVITNFMELEVYEQTQNK